MYNTVIKGVFPSASFPAMSVSVPAAGNGELDALAQLPPFTSMGVLSTAQNMCMRTMVEFPYNHWIIMVCKSMSKAKMKPSSPQDRTFSSIPDEGTAEP